MLGVVIFVILAGAGVGYYFYSIRKNQEQAPTTTADTFQNPFTTKTTKPQSSFSSAQAPTPTFANPFATTPTTYQNPFSSTTSGEEPYQNPFEKLR